MNEELYQLLPAIHCSRDLAAGGALRALLGVLEDDLDALRHDVDRLYEDFFIETTSEWLVPYIGDLLGVRPLHAVTDRTHSLRAYVANTLAYRRRKGTAAVLEQLARDLTGWPCRVVELFRHVAWSQHLAHLRPQARTLDLRRAEAVERIGGPFESATHSLEVRRIEPRRGRYNLPNIGLFLWRISGFELVAAEAEAVSSRRYRIHPRGIEAPLLNIARTEPEITHLAEETHVPGRLRRRPLYDELEAHRRAIASGRPTPRPRFFRDLPDGGPVLQLALVSATDEGLQITIVPKEEVAICNLEGDPDAGGWRIPAATRSYPVGATEGDEDAAPVELPIRIAVDPVSGRVSVPDHGDPPVAVLASYAYGFSAELGGGPYDREATVEQLFERWWNQRNETGRALDPAQLIGFQRGVQRDFTGPPEPGALVSTLRQAIEAWNEQPAGTCGVIALMDSGRYEEADLSTTAVVMKPGSRLLIVGAQWPVAGSQELRILGAIAVSGARPVIRGTLTFSVEGPGDGEVGGPTSPPAEASLLGVFVEGRVQVSALAEDASASLARLELRHSTVVPDREAPTEAAIALGSGHGRTTVVVDRCITGSIVSASAAAIELRDSIVDDFGSPLELALDGSTAVVEVEGSTLFGQTRVHSLSASNSIFLGHVHAARRQLGCIRFSYVPSGSRTPRRYRCQPDRALEARARALALAGPSALPPGERERVREQVQPRFTSQQLGQPTYARLAVEGPAEIYQGAEDGAEMGVFHHLQQPQREASLRQALEEYLRFGLEAGSLFVDEESGS